MSKTKNKNFVSSFITKFLLQFIGIIILLFVLAAFVLPYFLPVEKVIPIKKVNDILSEKAGINLELNGRTRISILPFLGVSAKNISLVSISPEFSQHKDAVFAKKIDIKLSVFPLLFGNVIIKNISLEGANINLFKCGTKLNVFSPSDIIKEANPDSKNEESVNLEDYIKSFGISKFTIKQSDFAYSECSTSKHYAVKGINADIVIPKFDGDISAKFAMTVNNNKVKINVESSNLKDILQEHKGNLTVDLSSDFGAVNLLAKYRFDKNYQTFLDQTTFKIKGNDIAVAKLAKIFDIEASKLAPIPGMNFTFEGKINSTNAIIEHLALNFGGIKLKGSDIKVFVPSRTKTETISAKGIIEIGVENIGSLVSAAGFSPSIIKRYPSDIKSQMFFSFASNVLKLEEKSHITIDGKTVINISAIADTMRQTKSVAFNVSSKVINIDEYLNLQNEQEKQAKNTNTPYVPILQKIDDMEIKLPSTNNLIVDGTVTIGKLIVRKVTIENVSSKLKIRQGKISNKISANVFDGYSTIEANIMEEHSTLRGIDIAASFKSFEVKRIMDILGSANLIEGKVDASLKFNSNAPSPRKILANGTGNMSINSNTLTVIGIDLDNLINDVIKDYKSLLSANVVKRYVSPEKRTSLDNFSADTSIARGVINNEKLTASKNGVSLNGHGTINLNNEQIKYTLLPANNSSPLPALVISGAISDPVYTIDPSLYIKDQIQSKIKNQIKNNSTVREKLSRFNNAINNFKL